MKIVLIGIPGAGKSTQGNLLSHQLKIPYLSTGHIFREIAKEKTKIGHYMKEVLHSGMLVPDDKTIEVVGSYLSRPEYQRGYILDGFPRTVHQAKQFENNVDKVFYLELPDKEALWRLAYRNDATRDDNTIEALKRRIELFHKFTDPVINHYKEENKLTILDGTEDIKDVNDEILKSIGKHLVKNQIHAWHQRHKSIIAIVGLPGVGKSEAADFFKQKKVPIVHFGNLINDYIDEHKLKHTEEVHKKLRVKWRKEHGQEAFAKLNKDNIKNSLVENNIVVIDGLRSWEEYLYLKKTFEEVKVYILALHTDKHIRYNRSAKRNYRHGLYGEEREINELQTTNMGPTIAFADFLIKNNFSLQEFHDKLENVYRTVYFS